LAFAQGVAFQGSSLPQQARIEGLTETVGAIVVQATAAGTVKAGSSISVTYLGGDFGGVSAPDAPGLITNLATSGASNVNDNVVFCSSSAICANVHVGPIAAGSNSLTLSFVADTAVGFGSYIVVSQVRVNVNGIPSN